MKNQVGFSYKMPIGQLFIVSSKNIDELEIDSKEEIEDVVYYLIWKINNKTHEFPLSFTTQVSAMGAAMGCQWGAYRFTEV